MVYRWKQFSDSFLKSFRENMFDFLFIYCSFQAWTDELMKLAYNLTQLNGSAAMFLQKAHTKLCLQVDKTGKIPIKKWVNWQNYVIFNIFTVKVNVFNKRFGRGWEKHEMFYGLEFYTLIWFPIHSFTEETFREWIKKLGLCALNLKILLSRLCI